MTVWESGRESTLLDEIIAGRKTIEGRLNRDKFAQYRVGDEIHLRRDWRDSKGVLHDGEADAARVTIVAIRSYESFLAMIQHEGVDAVIPGAKSIEVAVAQYDRYYSQEDQQKFGVLAIAIEVLR